MFVINNITKESDLQRNLFHLKTPKNIYYKNIKLCPRNFFFPGAINLLKHLHVPLTELDLQSPSSGERMPLNTHSQHTKICQNSDLRYNRQRFASVLKNTLRISIYSRAGPVLHQREAACWLHSHYRWSHLLTRTPQTPQPSEDDRILNDEHI